MRRASEIWYVGTIVNECNSSVGLFGFFYMPDFVCFSEVNHIIFSNRKEAFMDLGFYNSYNSIKLNILTAETSVFTVAFCRKRLCFVLKFIVHVF